MQRKAITPIIAIIVLLLITVALAGAAWTFLQGFLFPQITKSFVIPSGAAYCTTNGVTIYVLNTGYQSELTPSTDFIIADIDSSDISGSLSATPISTGQSGAILQDYTCGGTCSSGYHAIDLGTQSSVQHLSVYCP